MTEQVEEKMKRGLDLIHQGYQTRSDIWYSDVLFTWRWWFAVILSLSLWMLWVTIRDREKTHSLLYGGMFVMLTSLGIDAIGMQLRLWHYLYPIFPLIPAYLPFDLALMPVTTMLVIQYKPRIRPTIKGIFFSTLTTFVGEPLFRWLGIYQPLHWVNLYSWPLYLGIYLTASWLTTRAKVALENK